MSYPISIHDGPVKDCQLFADLEGICVIHMDYLPSRTMIVSTDLFEELKRQTEPKEEAKR
jgi:hypothetical protein